MKPLQKTDELAYHWLIQNKGIDPHKISFIKRGSPRFIAGEGTGQGYEVKLARGAEGKKSIFVSKGQYAFIKQFGYITLVFDGSSPEPVLIIPASELKEGEYKGINIIVGKDKRKSVKALLHRIEELEGQIHNTE